MHTYRAYSDIPIRFKTLVQKMHVVSVYLQYYLASPDIIWLPLQKSVQYIRRYLTTDASFFVRVAPDVYK